MQALETSTSEIAIGEGDEVVSVNTFPLSWNCPVAIDYEALERVGDFQLEMSELRFDDELDEEESDGDDSDE